MDEEKVLKSTAEKALISLAHKILRERNQMSLSDIREKAEDIVAIAEAKTQKPPSKIVEKTPALEDVLCQPITKITFEAVCINFVEQLFEGNNADFERIMSMLNSKENKAEAISFIEQQVQPDYDWSDKKSDVAAFIEHISQLYEA
ncbi:MAG: hypothetical protein CMC43_05125 [Flavobacteriaceae bacterium]|uniref:Uncharacterized protein n=1 Tax=uncultured Flavobacteriia bacterium TaxID=212695 RepID=H6RFF5_9BACT|nr:hypothetical protein [uncultured bacterium]MAS68695.1 hypothetical protein [Flavobacteriaceae bacterium]CCF99766.1 hypothetical protein VIS_S18BTA100005 [uncultured Flavobacteriia bacterium]|tara:strand:- start:4526 stop:4963 length:438 start_codon:yes stop_codon:yes gene_type:complete